MLYPKRDTIHSPPAFPPPPKSAPAESIHTPPSKETNNMQVNEAAPPVGNLRIYACGGMGVNVASFFESTQGAREPGYSNTHPCYIDTSRSNLKPDLNADNVYLLEGVDGSGKIRRENHEQIFKSVKNVLQKHAPMDFNVVVFSASGGSGSVFAPLVIGELLERGATVVAVVVGSDESGIAATNTLNTLKSLEAIAQRTELPVVMFYEQNEKDIKRSEIDDACHATIASLSVLASRQNAELDSTDIRNWVQFNRPTSEKPRLALLNVYRSNEDAAANAKHPITIASLYEDTDAPQLDLAAEYTCVGYPREHVKSLGSTHFVISVDDVPAIAKRMQQRITELDRQRQSRVEFGSIVSKDDEIAAGGLVL